MRKHLFFVGANSFAKAFFLQKNLRLTHRLRE